MICIDWFDEKMKEGLIRRVELIRYHLVNETDCLCHQEGPLIFDINLGDPSNDIIIIDSPMIDRPTLEYVIDLVCLKKNVKCQFYDKIQINHSKGDLGLYVYINWYY